MLNIQAERSGISRYVLVHSIVVAAIHAAAKKRTQQQSVPPAALPIVIAALKYEQQRAASSRYAYSCPLPSSDDSRQYWCSRTLIRN